MKSLSQRRPLRRCLAWAFSVALAVGVIGLLPACGGSSSARSDATVGKQLSTLRKAYDSGAITREEYERERRRIIGDW